MCSHCDYDSPDNRIYVDPLTNEYYLDIETKKTVEQIAQVWRPNNLFYRE